MCKYLRKKLYFFYLFHDHYGFWLAVRLVIFLWLYAKRNAIACVVHLVLPLRIILIPRPRVLTQDIRQFLYNLTWQKGVITGWFLCDLCVITLRFS